jgi:hypothetical protein
MAKNKGEGERCDSKAWVGEENKKKKVGMK